MYILHAKLILVLLEFESWKHFCEYVCNLIINVDMLNQNFPLEHVLSNKVMMDF